MLHINPLHEFQKSYLPGLLCKFLCSTLWSSPGRSLCEAVLLLLSRRIRSMCLLSVIIKILYFSSAGRKLKFIGATRRRRRRHETWQVFAKLSALSRARTRKTTDTLESLFDWLSWNWKRNPTSSQASYIRVEDVVEKQTFVFCD